MGMERMFSWPGWKTVRLLGEGSFGRVYEIERKIVDFTEKAALKVISIPHSENEIDDFRLSGYSDSSIRKRYEEHLKDVVHEYTLMKGLKECPNVVQCEDVRYEQHEDGIGWDILIKMELLTPLMQSLPMDVREKTVVQLGKDLCNALAECEKRNILHRDIKPQNIFVSSGGVYKLGDFGIAKAAERTTGGTKTGTYKFMAPEVYNNEPYGPKTDIYSLGMVLYWLLNDRREPFVETDNIPTAAEEEHARQRRFSGEELPYPKNGSIALKRIVCRACSANPDQRFRDAEEMLYALEQAEDQTVGVWTSASVRVDDATGREKSWLKWIAAALGAVLAGLMIAIGIKMYINRNTPAETPSPSTAVTDQTEETEEVPQEVTAVIITDVDDTGEPLRLKTGTEKKLNIRTEPEGVQADVVWTSSNPDVVAVDDSGTITCISPGSAVITVSCGNVSSVITIEVEDNDENRTSEKGMYRQYYDLCIDYQNRYGKAAYSAPEGQWPRMHGLCLVRCVDFDYDGTEELLICYANKEQSEIRDDYTCEVWGWSSGQRVLLLRTSDFNTRVTINGTWPIWVSIGSYLGDMCLMTQDDTDQSIYILKKGAFEKTTLSSVYSGNIMLQDGSYTYYINGQEKAEDDFAVQSMMHCFEEPFIIYEVKSGTGSVISSVGGQELIDFTARNIEDLRLRSS